MMMMTVDDNSDGEWEVHIVKNCDGGLENAARGHSRGQHFEAQGHSFLPHGTTLSQQITYFFLL